MEGVDSVHWMLSVEGRRDGNMDWREGILERPEHVLLFGEGKVASTVWREGPVGGRWFLREQVGMEERAGFRRDSLRYDREVSIHFGCMREWF